jgi:7,8-dihydropterin-6-yl-methyl-4-(beta-D-ribofuranosyl)aminobenzene 5'-phosphate synthase
MKVTALVENTRLKDRGDLVAEHGLSLHIEYDDRQILFDTGATGAFAHNAARLGVEPRQVDLACISHHHIDHGGGLACFLEANPEAKVYLRRRTAGHCYFRVFGILSKYVGLDEKLFEPHPNRFEFVDEFSEISPGVFLLTAIGRRYPEPKGNRRLFVREGKTWNLDRFEHELVLVIREKEGLVVFTGCSHSGILNMVDAVARRFPGQPIRAVFGGFHLIGLPMLNTMAATERDVEEIGEEMIRYSIAKVYTGHCTGPKAYRLLKGVLSERLEYLSTGSRVEV